MRNYAEALKWYKKAAEQEHPQALYKMGVMYEKGTGVRRDITKARKWYQMAASKGSLSARVHLGLPNSMTYEREKEVQHDTVMLKSFQKAAKQGQSEAFRLYHKAAERGEVSALYNLGLMYYNGQGTEKRYYTGF